MELDNAEAGQLLDLGYGIEGRKEVIGMGPKFISAWQNFTNSIVGNIRAAIDAGEVQANDIVWCGPDGSTIIASDPATLSEEYGDYVDSGQVHEYMYDYDVD